MILFLGFKLGSMVDILHHEVNWDVRYTNTKWVRVKVREILQHTQETTTCLPALKA